MRIPMRFQRRGGRKRIVAPDGSEIVPTLEAPARRHAGEGARAGVALAADARRRRVQDGRESGDAGTSSNRYVCRIVRLALLAPDIVEQILAGSRRLGWPGSWSRFRLCGSSSDALYTRQLTRSRMPALATVGRRC